MDIKSRDYVNKRDFYELLLLEVNAKKAKIEFMREALLRLEEDLELLKRMIEILREGED